MFVAFLKPNLMGCLLISFRVVFCKFKLRNIRHIDTLTTNTEEAQVYYLQNPNRKTVNVCIYQALSHEIQARFLSDDEKTTSTFPSRGSNVSCGDIYILIL